MTDREKAAPTPDDSTPCVCGHVLDEHDPYEGNTAPCTVGECDCIAFEAAENDDEGTGDGN